MDQKGINVFQQLKAIFLFLNMNSDRIFQFNFSVKICINKRCVLQF